MDRKKSGNAISIYILNMRKWKKQEKKIALKMDLHIRGIIKTNCECVRYIWYINSLVTFKFIFNNITESY